MGQIFVSLSDRLDQWFSTQGYIKNIWAEYQYWEEKCGCDVQNGL